MKKVLNRTNLLVALLFAFIVCLTGATTLSLTAHAQEEEPKSTVELTSYTTILGYNEEYEFAALVTLPNGDKTDEVTWTSSNEAVIEMLDNIAIAQELKDNAEETATITATAADGATASINVTVSNTAVRVSSVEAYPTTMQLGIGWTARVAYIAFPQDAFEQSAYFTSSNEAVATVDATGHVTSLAKGTTTITVTTRDKHMTAECEVTVYGNDELVEASLTPADLTINVGKNADFTLNLPEGVDIDKSEYHWYSSEDSVASIDRVEDNIGTAFGWSFGTTNIYVIALGSDGVRYYATGSVYVTADYFYIVGLESVNAADPWKVLTEEQAAAAGVLFTETAEGSKIFTVTRAFWEFDDFQIIHNDMDVGWTTRITPEWYVAEGSTAEYVANTAEMFRFNRLGKATVKLDLSDGRAKVYLEMTEFYVTSFDLSVAEGSEAYLQDVGDKMTLDAYTIPEDATIDLNDVVITTDPSMEETVSAEAQFNEDGKLQIVLTLDKAVESSTAFDLDVNIKNSTTSGATDSITITVLKAGEEYVAVSGIAFEEKNYTINVNNGDQEDRTWRVPIKASVNADASVQGVVYYENYDEIYIEYDEDGQAYVRATALGTFTIYAAALGNTKEEDTATVLVTSENGFYFIGILDGVMINNWASLSPETTSLTGTPYEKWALDATTDPAVYVSTEHHFEAYDVFSIAFLGMDGNWNGIIGEQNMDWDNSEGTYWESDGNVQITESGTYTIRMSLAAAQPSFTIVLNQRDSDINYSLTLYIVKGGDAYDGNVSEEANVIATVGTIEVKNGVPQTVELTLDSYDFYGMKPWPTIQFVTARSIEGGYFVGETWYGESYLGLNFTGDAYKDAEAEEGEAGYFTNFNNNHNAVLYWTGTMAADAMTVSFTFTFDETAPTLKAVAVNFVTPSTGDQAE